MLCNRISLARGKSINPADMSLPLSPPILLPEEEHASEDIGLEEETIEKINF